MNQDNKVILMDYKKKQKNNQLTDHEKLVYAYHYFEQDNKNEAIKIIGSINQNYWTTQFHKDICRALLCYTSGHPALGKDSEFYIVVYRLVKHIVLNKIHFNGSGHFYQLKDELYKDLM